MDISKVKKVSEITINEFHEYVKDGYVLLHVASEVEPYGEKGGTTVKVVYVMGKE